MITSKSFTDYRLLDAGDKEKLESWKGIILQRPDPMAIWPKTKPELWKTAQAIYHRSNTGGGYWQFNEKLPKQWLVRYKDLTFKVAPTDFKHTGLFPEQSANWDYIYEKVASRKDAKILNLFAYTGAASLVASKAGAKEVVHLDASKSINNWAKENMHLSHLDDHCIRFICEDALKFMNREIRRGRKYDGIIMDPPSYGRGPENELFKFEEQINPLIQAALQLLSDNPLFLIVNTYTTGFSQTAIYNALSLSVKEKGLNGEIESQEIGIQIENTEYYLPCGVTSRWQR